VTDPGWDGLLDRLVAADADADAAAASAGDELAAAFGRMWTARDRDGADGLLDAVARRAAAGSRPAVEVLLGLVHRHHLAEPAAAGILVTPADLDDALQLTLIAVLEHVGSYEGRARFRTWLSRVARNEALMVLRRKQRKSEPSGEPVPDGAGFVRRLSSVLADQLTVQALLDSLPVHYRVPLALRELDQLEYEEIADRLGIPIGTVRSRIARGREQLARRAWR
jgi:RNA polymerase sigma-70 factor (ECF subfamily)